jgi:hypothetical protein
MGGRGHPSLRVLREPVLTDCEAPNLARVDLEVDVNLGSVVELADRPGVTLVVVVLRVDFVVDGGESWKTVGAVLSHDVGFHGMGARVGEVHDGTDDGIILRIEDFAGEQPALLLVFFIERTAGHGNQKDERANEERGVLER